MLSRNILASLLAVALVAGCSSTPEKTDTPAASGPATGQSGVQTQGMDDSATRVDPLHDPNNILSKRSIYFAYDSFDVAEDFRPTVEAHARYLLQHPNAKVFLQGNTDERGSREYNLSLGQKRADAVRRMMSVLGVSDVQIETVSFGEEKPRATCHDESCWAENRRVDIVYVGE